MFVDTAKTKLKNGKTYIRHLLRTSYWGGGMTRHTTIANLSSCTEEEIEAKKFALKHKGSLSELVSLNESVSIEQGKSIGAVRLYSSDNGRRSWNDQERIGRGREKSWISLYYCDSEAGDRESVEKRGNTDGHVR